MLKLHETLIIIFLLALLAFLAHNSHTYRMEQLRLGFVEDALKTVCVEEYGGDNE